MVVNGTEAAHEVFVKHGDVTSGRPDVFFFRDVGGRSGEHSIRMSCRFVILQII